MTFDSDSGRGYGKRDCPSCRAERHDSVREVSSSPPAESRPFSELQQNWYGFFDKKLFFSYSQCKTCGILFAATYFTPQQLEILYSSMPANMAEASHTALEETQRGYFNELKNHSDLRGHFLEIGPDTGLFAKNCAREGSFSKFWMFEPNVAAHAELRSRLGTADAHISKESLDLSAVPESQINAIAMIHVVDHLLDPVPFLRELRKKTAPNATVLIVTHDESSLLARITGARWPAYCLQHPQLFNPTSIRLLLRAAGYEVVKTTRSVNHFPIPFLLEHAILAAGLGKIKLPAFNAVRIPLRLGNFITIAKPD